MILKKIRTGFYIWKRGKISLRRDGWWWMISRRRMREVVTTEDDSSAKTFESKKRYKGNGTCG